MARRVVPPEELIRYLQVVDTPAPPSALPRKGRPAPRQVHYTPSSDPNDIYNRFAAVLWLSVLAALFALTGVFAVVLSLSDRESSPPVGAAMGSTSYLASSPTTSTSSP